MSKREPTSTPLSIESISVGLMAAIKGNQAHGWQRLLCIYGPVVYRWCVRAGVSACDAEEIVQEVFLAVTTGIHRFRRENANDSFVAWLRTITRYKLADYWRRKKQYPPAIGGSQFYEHLQQLDGGGIRSDSSLHSEPSDRSIVLSQAMNLVRPLVQENTWNAFWQTAVLCRTTKDVADDLKMSEMAVRQAKSRILRKIRDHIALVDLA